jgi:hypothetical protein
MYYNTYRKIKKAGENLQVKIIINENVCLTAILNETGTAQKVFAALPIKGSGETWGEEIYFTSKVEAALENPREVLQAGEIAYWPPIKALCIFFGPTPASRGEEMRAAGPVNVIGKIEGDLNVLRDLKEPLEIMITRGP